MNSLRSIAKYLLQINALVDSLVSIGHSVSQQEHMDVILDILPFKYDTFVTAIIL